MGEANAILAKAKAKAEALQMIAQAIGKKVRPSFSAPPTHLFY